MNIHNIDNYQKIINKVVELGILIEKSYFDSKNSIFIEKEQKDDVDFVTALDKQIELELKNS